MRATRYKALRVNLAREARLAVKYAKPQTEAQIAEAEWEDRPDEPKKDLSINRKPTMNENLKKVVQKKYFPTTKASATKLVEQSKSKDKSKDVESNVDLRGDSVLSVAGPGSKHTR